MARAKGAGLALKGFQWLLRAIELGCAALILGVFTYFIVTLHNHGLNIDNYTRAIEGISGAAVLYTLIGLLLLCFLAGLTFFSLIAILMDIAFIGAFIFVAYETRSGARSCSGTITTVFGTGDADSDNTVPDPNGGSTALPSFKQTCRLETACFAVAIAAIFFFLLSILLELALMRHHRKEKAFGPSPANNYTTGSTPRRTRPWQRKHDDEVALATTGLVASEKRHPDSLPVHSAPENVRGSYNTDTTAVGSELNHHHNGTGTLGNGYTAPSAGYREPAYPNAGPTTATARDDYPAGGHANTAAYEGAYPATGATVARETEYRTPTTGTGGAASAGAFDTEGRQYLKPGEIPASEYLNNTIHHR